MEVTCDQMEYITSMLRELPGNRSLTALSNAANRAAISARSASWQAVHEEYTVKQSAFYRETKITTVRANSRSPSAAVNFTGHLIPLIDYKHSQSGQRSARTIKTEVLTGEPKDLRHAYIADLGRYGPSVFERLTPARNSSSALYGPAAAHMVRNGEVLEKMDKAAMETFEKRLEHEVDRILRGYGGRR